jgi:putative endonuclease
VKYYTYILKCTDDTLYTGIITDLKRRVTEHSGEGNLGARYVKARRPVKLVYSVEFPDRSSTLKEEYRIKQLSRAEKENLFD